MTHILVIGSPSLDKLHFGHRTVSSAGGAGMYTAMAAVRCGVQVSLFAPRPKPMPSLLQPVSQRLTDWLGPEVAPGDMPRFEIAHDGDRAAYLEFFIGAESQLDPALLPDDLSCYDAVHVIPLGDARKQQEFLYAVQARGACFISVGTFFQDAHEMPHVVKANIERSQACFMNEQEAVSIYGSLEGCAVKHGKTLFVTLGEKGALVIQGDHHTCLPAVPAQRLDPTGAGDTFCGATLAFLAQGVHPVMAARYAVALAAQVVEQVGPSALLEQAPPPGIPDDARLRINERQITAVAPVIDALPEAEPFDFVGDDFPPVNHPSTQDFFFAVMLQQFGFWSTAQNRYSQPLIADINGEQLKGSSYLFRCYLRPLQIDPEFYSPVRQAQLTDKDLQQIFLSDDGSQPMPALDLHVHMARTYGRSMLELGLTPQEILRISQEDNQPLKKFLCLLDHIGGYREDPLRKKSSLLALCLNQRPEAFLRFGEHEKVAPVIDYHAMRSCLRLGLVDVVDEGLKETLAERYQVSKNEEWAVRFATFRMQEKMAELTLKDQGAIDWFFFNYMRSHCPEMQEPVCEKCAADPVCAHRKQLFQPVFRTSFY